MAEVAMVGWAVSALGWVVSPVTARLLNVSDAFALLGFDESEKLRDLEALILPQLAMLREQAERIPPAQRAHVELWASSLRAAFYDAEDVLDVADYHRLQNQVNCQSGTKSALDRAKHLISGKAGKLKKVMKKLEKLIEQGSQFLTPLASNNRNGSHGNDTSSPANNANRIVTTSSPLAHIIFGRDEERDEIIRLLHQTESDFQARSGNSECYSVIGIHGIAGSGKTTLAQLVCTYEQTNDYFYPIMWIHVSQNFNVDKIYLEMLEAASREPCHQFSNLDSLQKNLKEQLKCKRFFLVLDDIWDVKDQEKLDKLLSPLRVGKKGSMVLVTTRFKEAAISLGAKSLMKIPDLNEIDFFNLFMHHALDGASATLDDHELETFQMIGKQILKKLKGSPLAAKVVGKRLRKNMKATFWRRVRDQDVLPDTMGALWWSYQHLDAQVRRCFAYCSMFPQGYMFKRDELVDLWIAEGFIKITNNPDDQMEDVARNCFDELVSCSFLETRKYTLGRKDEWFTMHDLLHELVVMVAGNDFFRIEGGEMKEFPPDVRHLYVRSKDQFKFTEQICKLRKLRTLIFITNIGGQGITVQELEGILKNLKKLRVLQVVVEGYMAMIPTCICELKHLRFVRIHNPLSTKVHLPKKMGRIYHLQILELWGSGVLDFSNVKYMSYLISLRSIRYSGFSFDNSDISGFSGLGQLKSLRGLSDFKVRQEKGYELQQLKDMNHLSGSLRISGLDCVQSKEVALEAKLSDKTDLTALSLEWSGSSGPEQHTLQVEILEGLCPPSQLAELRVCGYGGWQCPSWLSQNQNMRLQYLELRRCYNLKALPEIGDLFIHLGHLKLVSLPVLEKLPRLPNSLKALEIEHCETLVVTCGADVDMMRSRFVELASQMEPSLNISTTRAEEIGNFAEKHPESFKKILCAIFGRCDSLPQRLIRVNIREEDYSRLMLPASVDRVIISYCAITDTALHSSLRASTSLFSLNLRALPFFTEIPSEVMESLPMLCDLSIDDCFQFKHLHGLSHLSRLQHLGITKCPNLSTAHGESDKARILHGIAIDDIPLVPQLLSRDGCSSLWSLRIDESDELREKEILQQFLSLKSLSFSCCKWTSLPDNLATLTSLDHLCLDYCKEIRSLPTLPTSLRSIELIDCDPSFMKSCQKAGHPNWNKIAHIPEKRFCST